MAVALLRPPRDRPGDGAVFRRQVQAVEKAAPAVGARRDRSCFSVVVVTLVCPSSLQAVEKEAPAVGELGEVWESLVVVMIDGRPLS